MEQTTFLWAITVAMAIDWAFGEPSNRFHPVAYLGKAIGWLEQRLFVEPYEDEQNLTKGAILAAIIIGGAGIAGYALTQLLSLIHPYIHGLAEGWLGIDTISTGSSSGSSIGSSTGSSPFTPLHVATPEAESAKALADIALGAALGVAFKPCFALSALIEEGKFQRLLLFRHRVQTQPDDTAYDIQVRWNPLEQARDRLRHLCSRDTAELTPEEISEVTISSMAENLCDSFVAPLIAFALFGLPGAFIYRAINTLDAMVGYRGRYELFGRVSAKLDDFANYLPARLTGYLLICAGWLTAFTGGDRMLQGALLKVGTMGSKGGATAKARSLAANRRINPSKLGAVGIDPERGLKTMLRDHDLTPSPNGGWPMAAMAGLLGIQLRKRGLYQLGDKLRPSCDRSIAASLMVILWAAGLTVLFVILLQQTFSFSP